MITIKEVMAWLKGKDGKLEGKIFNSSINANLSECVGVYARRNGPVQPMAIGKESSYQIKPMTLLVHWSKNADTCETKALELWDLLKKSSTNELIGNSRCWIIARNAPVSVGKDDFGIFESVVDFDIYTRKKG